MVTYLTDVRGERVVILAPGERGVGLGFFQHLRRGDR